MKDEQHCRRDIGKLLQGIRGHVTVLFRAKCSPRCRRGGKLDWEETKATTEISSELSRPEYHPLGRSFRKWHSFLRLNTTTHHGQNLFGSRMWLRGQFQIFHTSFIHFSTCIGNHQMFCYSEPESLHVYTCCCRRQRQECKVGNQGTQHSPSCCHCGWIGLELHDPSARYIGIYRIFNAKGSFPHDESRLFADLYSSQQRRTPRGLEITSIPETYLLKSLFDLRCSYLSGII